jgi:hypothetical protein
VSHPLRRVVVVVAAVAVAATGGYLVATGTGLSGSSSSSAPGTGTGGPGRTEASEPTPPAPVSTAPPTAVATDPPVTSAPGGEANVFISRVQWDYPTSSVRAAGYVSGVLELEGSCTLTITNGTTEREVTAAAEPDATTMTCGTLTVPGQDLTSGTWSAVLRYESGTARGESAPADVDVP